METRNVHLIQYCAVRNVSTGKNMQWRQVFQMFRVFFAFQPFSAGELWWFDTAWCQSEPSKSDQKRCVWCEFAYLCNLIPLFLNMSLDKVRSFDQITNCERLNCADCLHKELYQEDGNTMNATLPATLLPAVFLTMFSNPRHLRQIGKLTKPSDLWTQEFSVWVHGAFDIDEMNRINFTSSPSLTLSLTFWGCKGQSYRQGRPLFQWVGTTRRSWEINSQHGHTSKMNVLHVYYSWYRYNCG